MSDRAWNVRFMRPEEGKREVFARGVAVYRKERRADGLFIWKFDHAPSGLEYPNGTTPAESDSQLQKALAEGRAFEQASGIPYEARARHGGLAVTMSDLLAPELEATWRLDGMYLQIGWKWATKAKKRIKARLIRVSRRVKEGGRRNKKTGEGPVEEVNSLVANIGCVTRKQLEDLCTVLRLPHLQYDKLPTEDRDVIL